MGLSVASKDRVKRMLPKPVMYAIRSRSLSSAQRADRRRYLRYSSSVRPDASRENLAAWMTMLYHNIEKGLSLPDPRPGFGEAAVARLVEHVSVYLNSYGSDEVSEYALGALSGYLRFNLQSGVEPQAIPSYSAIVELLGDQSDRSGGVKEILKDDVERATAPVDLDFFLTRSSVRQFSSQSVEVADVEFAVAAAQKSPAVCNRQFGRVYFTADRNLIDDALRIQGGARGFGDAVPALAVITTSARAYWNPEERMQPWTDGGMFAMSFVMGLHARGLGSVCLNWSKTPATDAEFRAAFSVGDDEVVVMMVAFGHLPDSYSVAASPRVPLSQTLRALTKK